LSANGFRLVFSCLLVSPYHSHICRFVHHFRRKNVGESKELLISVCVRALSSTVLHGVKSLKSEDKWFFFLHWFSFTLDWDLFCSITVYAQLAYTGQRLKGSSTSRQFSFVFSPSAVRALLQVSDEAVWQRYKAIDRAYSCPITEVFAGEFSACQTLWKWLTRTREIWGTSVERNAPRSLLAMILSRRKHMLIYGISRVNKTGKMKKLKWNHTYSQTKIIWTQEKLSVTTKASWIVYNYAILSILPLHPSS
jgi:hypothetical protein